MDRTVKVILQVILVIFAATLLCLVVPVMTLLEMFLVLIGGLVIAIGGLIIAREVNKLIDLEHQHEMRRELRKLKLTKCRQQTTASSSRRGLQRGRNTYYH
jgi:hypothetical protein